MEQIVSPHGAHFSTSESAIFQKTLSDESNPHSFAA